MVLCLITGAVGCIGSRVSEMLVAQGHSVTGVDNLNDAYDVHMIEYRLQKLHALSGFIFVKLDISDPDSVTRHADLVTPALTGSSTWLPMKGCVLA